MISICVPIYNFNVNKLVTELSKQIKACSIPIELVLIDDCSSEEYKTLNKEVCKIHKYIELEKNIGRSKIRNLFLKYTSFDYLLFLDCDSLIISDQFIQNYIDVLISSKAQIVCGGRIYEKTAPSANQKLSCKYGVKRESKSSEERMKSPYSSFMTNNFLVIKEVLEQIPFDERLSEYGHEDTLFGYYLKENKISILHLNNTVLNGDIEENITYLKKTELGIENLVSILDYVNDEKTFIESVSLLSFYEKIKSAKQATLVLFFAPILNLIFKVLLKLGLVNLTLFNYYKLSYLIKTLKQKKSSIN